MSKSKKRSSRPNRFGFSLLGILQIILLLVTLLLINYLASQNPLRADFSRTLDYTLSSSTTNYLKSETMQNRERPVRWTMIFRRSSPFYERVRGLAEEYEQRSGKRIELEVVDPIRSPERTQEIIANYNLTLARDLIVIDARASDEDLVVIESEKGASTLQSEYHIGAC